MCTFLQFTTIWFPSVPSTNDWSNNNTELQQTIRTFIRFMAFVRILFKENEIQAIKTLQSNDIEF